jgi:transposase
MQAPGFYGIDVAKEELVIAAEDGSCGTIANRPKAIQRWLSSLAPRAAIGLESTGGYHRTVLALCARAGHATYLLDPHQVHAYRRALGFRGKTDRLDAQTICAFLKERHARLFPYREPSRELRHLQRLLRRRAAVARHRQALRRALADCPQCRHSICVVLQALEQLLRQLERAALLYVHACRARAAHFVHLDSIDGVGTLTAAALVVALERISYRNSDAFVAALGLDPRPHDSGQMRGVRHLSKRGDPELRRLLYCAAMAARRSAAFSPLYERWRIAGKSTTAALVMLARKIARIAFALYRSNTSFNPLAVTAMA